ncbi:HTH-type transcriptional regulator YofA [Aquisphaera giovannonii]|uniref:HTH-type transcriptional regulator YofA n=1 Tax=Aquisphaera giovannonii TaxID=406548 RepID=A0A5B9W7N7_9BACT|nr:LysR family transcriptional regulator [Aquisphaera giovannonii]QEH36702.1 HTH-type transcriptional regulator YofA [Aquisphaera giovannonii]
MSFVVDTLQLKGFVAIADTGTFGKAAATVNRTQSALSLQIKKLEEQLGCVLFDRTGRRVVLTPEGEIFLGYARRMIQLQWEAFSRLREPDIEGEIRFGTPEDFATHYLPSVLSTFRQHHPRVELNVACDLTLNLLDGFALGQYDAILVKRDPQRVRGGTKVWREPLIWAAADGYRTEEPLSLVLSPMPCIYRARALAALDRAKRTWHIRYTSPSLAGTVAAVKAGLGVTILPANMVPAGVHPARDELRLPELADAEVALMKRDELSRAAQVFCEHIVHSLESRGRQNAHG